jgi:thymidylate synthase
MNSLDKQYQELLKTILEHGVEKKDRTGTGTKSIFGYTIRHNMSEGFPLLTTKKMAWKTMVAELLWFLRGDTNIKFLVDNNCHIWDGDAYKNYLNVVMFEKPGYLHEKHGHLNMSVKKEGDNYLPFTQEEFINKIKTDDKFRHWGELGPIYGKQWRDWKGPDGYDWNTKVSETSIDQIANLINDLKTNPDSRRLMVSAWNVGELNQMVLPPCHYGFQVYTRELSEDERYDLCAAQKSKMTAISEEDYIKYNIPTRAISLMWNQRSVDTFLGLPFNIASYGLLLTMLADEVNMVPDQLIGNLGDTHIYLNHIEQAKEQIGREYTEEEILEHLQQSGMDALVYEARMEYISKLPKRTREPYPLPTVHVRDGIFCSSVNDIILENYQSHPAIKAPLSN